VARLFPGWKFWGEKCEGSGVKSCKIVFPLATGKSPTCYGLAIRGNWCNGFGAFFGIFGTSCSLAETRLLYHLATMHSVTDRQTDNIDANSRLYCAFAIAEHHHGLFAGQWP